MTLWNGYVGIENLVMTNPQRDALVDRLRNIGQKNGGAAKERMQFRVRLDNQAAIFEATFDDSNLTTLAVRTMLASIFGVTLASISATSAAANFGNGTTQYATFTRTGTDYLRVAVFGGTTSTWDQSRLEEQAYRALNLSAWGDD